MSDSCNPMNCSPPDSSVHGIFQARILEWVAIYSYLKSLLNWLQYGFCSVFFGRDVGSQLPDQGLNHIPCIGR